MSKKVKLSSEPVVEYSSEAYNETPVDKLINAISSCRANESRYLEGRLLTIVDASFTDREQRGAVKSLVRNAIWESSNQTVEIVNQFASKFGEASLKPSETYGSGELETSSQNWFPSN